MRNCNYSYVVPSVPGVPVGVIADISGPDTVSSTEEAYGAEDYQEFAGLVPAVEPAVGRRGQARVGQQGGTADGRAAVSQRDDQTPLVG